MPSNVYIKDRITAKAIKIVHWLKINRIMSLSIIVQIQAVPDLGKFTITYSALFNFVHFWFFIESAEIKCVREPVILF